MIRLLSLSTVGLVCLLGTQVTAQPQTMPGAGNASAVAIASRSPLVQSAVAFLVQQTRAIHDAKRRHETHDAIANPTTCIYHRAGLTDSDKDVILQTLLAQGLVHANDNSTFPGGLKAGVFPPVLQDGTPCPQLPQPFFSAPGSVFHGH